MAAANAGFFGDKLLGIECTLEAETLVSNLTQYKLFIGDDKNMPFGVTSFKQNKNNLFRDFCGVKISNVTGYITINIPEIF